MLGDKLLPDTKPGFLKSEKMLGFILLYSHKSVLENVYVNNIIILWMMLFHTLTYDILADVIANWETLLPDDIFFFFFFFFYFYCYRLMLLPFVFISLADVLANDMWQKFCQQG